MAAGTIWGIVFIFCALIIFTPIINTKSRRVQSVYVGVMIAALFGMQAYEHTAATIGGMTLIFGFLSFAKGVRDDGIKLD